jgi:hypothetical protein
MTIATLFLILALVLFLLAAFSVPMGRFNATAGGLACCVIAALR